MLYIVSNFFIFSILISMFVSGQMLKSYNYVVCYLWSVKCISWLKIYIHSVYIQNTDFWNILLLVNVFFLFIIVLNFIMSLFFFFDILQSTCFFLFLLCFQFLFSFIISIQCFLQFLTLCLLHSLTSQYFVSFLRLWLSFNPWQYL